MKNMVRIGLGVVLGGMGVVACSGSTPTAVTSPYTSDAGKTVIVGDGTHAVYTTPDGSACLQIGTDCVKPQDRCGPDARADVIVDSQGKVIDIVCYPADPAPPQAEASGDVALGKENKGVVAIDGANDGVDIAGNVSAEGNKVTVYGQGSDVSVIGGSVTATGNNFAARGVRVKGNLTIEGNDAAVVLSVIEGDVIVHGNNTVLAECTVFGKVTMVGDNEMLVSNRVQGALSIDGNNALCDGDAAFTDANGDGVVASSELGSTLTCGK